MNEIYKNCLEHHGILGQKWGRKNGPPYPLSAGAHSAAEKKAGWRKSLGSYMKAKKEKMQADRVQKAEQKKQAEEDAHNKAREDALTSGNADEILKYKNELSTEDLNSALNRARAVSNLEQIADGKRLSGLKRTMDTVRTIKDAVNLGIDSVNTATRVKSLLAPKKDTKEYNRSQQMMKDALEKYGQMSMEELMKTDTMKKMQDELKVAQNYKNMEKIADGEKDKDKK